MDIARMRRDLSAEVIDPYRTGLEGRITIDNRVQPPLPPVVVDRTLIARALANIVENALHAMPGEGRLSIHAVVEPAATKSKDGALLAFLEGGKEALAGLGK